MGMGKGRSFFGAALCLVFLVHQIEKLVALQCYDCPKSPSTKECSDNGKGDLVTCTRSFEVCFEGVQRGPLFDKDGKEKKMKPLKGCISPLPGSGKQDVYCLNMGSTYDLCQCKHDGCNFNATWPERDNSTSK